jgi:hypothetical protein
LTRTDSPASYLERYLDPFRDLLRRDDVVEIAINPDGKVWLEVAGDATMRHEGQGTVVPRGKRPNAERTNRGDGERGGRRTRRLMFEDDFAIDDLELLRAQGLEADIQRACLARILDDGRR